MITTQIIYNYFDGLTTRQKEQFEMLYDLYIEWNAKVNVISRKDSENLYLHHVLHSLAIAKVKSFEGGEVVMDIGCGGGFPGIPLAIMFPETHFVMVDSIGKKITVVKSIAEQLGLTNIEAHHKRAEELKVECDFVVSRAVTSLGNFMPWAWPKLKSGGAILYLKGGDLDEEITEGTKGYKTKKLELHNISDIFSEEFFETKKVLYIEK